MNKKDKKGNKIMKVYLASQSPRRKELLELMGVSFECIPSDKPEDMTKTESLEELSERLAKQKAEDIFNKLTGDRLVIGSDTLVCLENKRFGKPKDEKDAKYMLESLSGKAHQVISSLSVILERNGQRKEYLTNSITEVKFIDLSNEMIDNYIKSGEPMDKAGAYAIQGRASIFVEKINGSYSSVIGLPTHLLFEILKKENIL